MRVPEKISTSALLTTPQPLIVWITTNYGKFFKRWEYQTCLLRNLYAGQKATVKTGHGTTDWFQIGKGIQQGCILSPYLTYMQSTSWEMLDWMKHKLESRLPEEISINSYADDTTLMAESQEELKRLLIKLKEENEKLA